MKRKPAAPPTLKQAALAVYARWLDGAQIVATNDGAALVFNGLLEAVKRLPEARIVERKFLNTIRRRPRAKPRDVDGIRPWIKGKLPT